MFVDCYLKVCECDARSSQCTEEKKNRELSKLSADKDEERWNVSEDRLNEKVALELALDKMEAE